MNKTEILTDLASKFTALTVLTKHATHGVSPTVTPYTQAILDVASEIARSANVAFVVLDEGEAGEAAYYLNAVPKPPAPEPTFAQEATAWLLCKIDVTVGDKIIRMFTSLQADNVQERAAAQLTLEDTTSGDLTEVGIRLWRVGGVFQYKLITV